MKIDSRSGFRHESQLELARTEQYDDQDSRSIKLQCVSCRSSHNTARQSVPRERTRRRIDRIALAPSRNRSAKRTPASSVRMHHHRAHRRGFFPSRPSSARRDAKCTRAATRTATHVACRVTTNLAAYVLAESKGEPFICKILARRASPAGSSSSSRARKPAPSFRVKNDLADNRWSGLPRRQAAPRCHLRPFLIDRFLLIDR